VILPGHVSADALTPARDELVGVDIGERRERKACRSDQLGEHAAGAERDQRPEDWILDRAGKELGARGDERLDDHGRTDLRCRP